MKDYKIKYCSLIYTGGGVYIAKGQLEDGTYFNGEIDGYMVTKSTKAFNDLDLEDVVNYDDWQFWANNKSIELSYSVIKFKEEHDMTDDDNFCLSEVKTILDRKKATYCC